MKPLHCKSIYFVSLFTMLTAHSVITFLKEVVTVVMSSNAKKQLILFGNFTKDKSKKYKIYKDPKGNYESFVER